MKTCSDPDCDRPVYAKELCSAHYQKARYHGLLTGTPTRQCDHCGQPMTGGNRAARFCSRQCIDKARQERRQEAARKARADRRCQVCDGLIPVTLDKRAKCCSRKCNTAYQNQKQRAQKREQMLASRQPCKECGGEIPDERRGGSLYCSPACKRKTNDIVWRARSPHYNRQRLYGLSPERYEGMLAEQAGRCAICRTNEWRGKDNKPHVDHDGETGKVRGLLCPNCNNGIGMLGHDPARLRAAAEYLEKHR